MQVLKDAVLPTVCGAESPVCLLDHAFGVQTIAEPADLHRPFLPDRSILKRVRRQTRHPPVFL